MSWPRRAKRLRARRRGSFLHVGRSARPSGLVLIVCLLGWVAAPASTTRVAAQRSPATLVQPIRSLTLRPPCYGRCSVPQLAQIDERTLWALWSGQDDIWWAQQIDVVIPAVNGEPIKLGAIHVGDALSNGPTIVPLPDGDLVLLGVLADGRVTFARGSSAKERQIGARAVIPASPSGVLSVAAAPANDAIALLLLHAPGTKVAPAQLALHALDARGEALRPALHWNAPGTTDARLASCSGQLYAAWRDRKGVVLQSFSSAFEPRKTRRFSLPGFYSPISGLLCSGREARLLTAVQDGRGTYTLWIAGLSELNGAAKAGWRKLTLPDSPHVTAAGLLTQQISETSATVELLSGGAAYGLPLDLQNGSHGEGTHLRIDQK